MLGALLFVLHPLQVESVAWISESRGLLAATFTLAAVLAICRATEPARLSGSDDLASSTPRAAMPTRLLWHGLGLLLVAAALLSKPSAVTAPVVAAAVLWAGRHADWAHLARGCAVAGSLHRGGDRHPARPVHRGAWHCAAAVAAADGRGRRAVLLQREALLACGARPRLRSHTGVRASGWWPLSALAVVIIAGGAAIFLSRRSPLVLAGSAIAVGSLLPVLGLANFHHQVISTVADRYMYVPLFGVGLMAAAGMAGVRSRRAWCAALGAAAALGVLSFRQSAHWVNDETLWRHNVAVVPRFPARAQQPRPPAAACTAGWLKPSRYCVAALEASERLAVVLVNVAELRLAQGRTSDAEVAYRRAIDAAPNYTLAAVGLGALLGQTGRPAEARAMFERALAAEPGNVQAMNNLGAIRLREGDTAGGARLLENVLARDSGPRRGALQSRDGARARESVAPRGGALAARRRGRHARCGCPHARSRRVRTGWRPATRHPGVRGRGERGSPRV